MQNVHLQVKQPSAAASAGLLVMAGIYFDVGKLVFLVRTITERFRRGYVGNCCC